MNDPEAAARSCASSEGSSAATFGRQPRKWSECDGIRGTGMDVGNSCCFKFNRHSLSVLISLLNLRQIKAEGASLADFTLDHDLTTVSFQNQFHQCQTQACASVAPF